MVPPGRSADAPQPVGDDDTVASDDRRDGGDSGECEDDDEPASEVAAALAAVDPALADAVESALAGRSGLVAVGVPLSLLPPILAARERSTGEPWRIACRPGVVDVLGRAFALGTAVAEAVATDALELRVHPDGGEGAESVADDDRTAQRILFATPDRVDAVAGPTGNRALVTETGSTAATAAARTAAARFDRARPATVDMPARSRLLAAASDVLDERFADDVAAVLDALSYGEVGRTGTVTDQTLLVALAARHDHLFWDLRRWVEGESERGGESDGDTDIDGGETGPDVGIAPGQELTADRRALVDRELIESIKVPMGPGRPQFRLRAVDDALLRARPEEVLSVLRGRFALPVTEDGTLRRGPGGGERRPVWERKRTR
ncbi:hypothetical protein C461_06519 [Halorubrum aidingense JCM 13560]|uniref:Uncharacterized protein n=1 Tax=Halorubrum aidingense JCM 13560 TaxID=1230454 RepID=M0PF77_9EURY|nr:DUF5821 family protein [Halorubrum aidingense]EMA68214.1 hypothetical protein C461_06519 [Halorubrum aidingense JCM 13560]